MIKKNKEFSKDLYLDMDELPFEYYLQELHSNKKEQLEWIREEFYIQFDNYSELLKYNFNPETVIKIALDFANYFKKLKMEDNLHLYELADNGCSEIEKRFPGLSAKTSYKKSNI